MCRVLIYLGKQSVVVNDLIFAPDNSLIRQSYDPKLMSHIQNLAGFGMAVWSKESHDPCTPFYYRTTGLPFFDQNLLRLSKKICANCLLAHVRGVSYDPHEVVVTQNAHPFKFEGFSLALAHNGSLSNMASMKRVLVKLIKPEIYAKITGTTDSEWIYSLFMSQFDDPKAKISLDEAYEALINTLKLIRKVRAELAIESASPVNLFVTNGEYVIVTRFVYDYGCHAENVEKAFLEYHSLWFTYGEIYGSYDGSYIMHGNATRNNIIFASEPLTENRTTWIELPEYSISKAWFENDTIVIRTNDLNV